MTSDLKKMTEQNINKYIDQLNKGYETEAIIENWGISEKPLNMRLETGG